jgi:hypothetical protein
LLRQIAKGPAEVDSISGQDQPFGKEQGQIEGLEIRREDWLFTSAKFIFVTKQGRYKMETLVRSHHIDGMTLFGGVQVWRATKQ